MRIREYFDLELRTTLASTLAGAVAGYASFLINQPKLNVALAIAVLAATALALKKTWAIKKERKWWISNAVFAFLLSWLIVWTIFYNTKII